MWQSNWVPHANSTAVLNPLQRRFFEDVCAVTPHTGHPLEVEHLPNGRTTLVFRILSRGQSGDISVAGPRTRAEFKTVTGLERVVMVRFRPGWSAPILGVSANALTNRVVNLEDIWGTAAAVLRRRLLASATLQEVLEQLTYALLRRTQRNADSSSASLARQAVRLLDAGEQRVQEVALQLGITGRHLRRVFTESVGIAPKDYMRAVRLQRVMQWTESTTEWAHIATEAGYYDQAHLISDFHQLVGSTPGAFLRRERALRFHTEYSAG